MRPLLRNPRLHSVPPVVYPRGHKDIVGLFQVPLQARFLRESSPAHAAEEIFPPAALILYVLDQILLKLVCSPAVAR